MITAVYAYHLGVSEESCPGLFCSFFEWRSGQERLHFACAFVRKRLDTTQRLSHSLLGLHTQGARLLLSCWFFDSESIQEGKERALLLFPNFFVLDKSTALLAFLFFDQFLGLTLLFLLLPPLSELAVAVVFLLRFDFRLLRLCCLGWLTVRCCFFSRLSKTAFSSPCPWFRRDCSIRFRDMSPVPTPICSPASGSPQAAHSTAVCFLTEQLARGRGPRLSSH